MVSTVVRAVTTRDQLDQIGREEFVKRTTYAYHDGYYEGIEQEFRGFGAADAITLGEAGQETSIARSHFHQGRRPSEIASDRIADNPDEALKGREYLSEVFDEAGTHLSTGHAAFTVPRTVRIIPTNTGCRNVMRSMPAVTTRLPEWRIAAMPATSSHIRMITPP